MRAAFKAVQDGKQVAVLTPTTVLSFQHFESFKKRFANFPVKVEMLSRFRTAKEKTAIVEQVEAGKVDILIGTHAILAQKLKFQDLGLLVVDEEQRFGVRHKERLKQMRAAIDVLAMSATPIPRTLHMSLMGLRDMSVIEDAAQGPHGDPGLSSPSSTRLIRHRNRDGARTRRPDLFRQQSRRDHLRPRVEDPRAGPFSTHRRGPRPAPRGRARTRHARLHEPRVRRLRRHLDHRERSRHSAGQHHHREPGRSPWIVGAISAARPRRPLQPPRLRIFAHPS